LRLDHFVSKFTYMPTASCENAAPDVEETAYRILQRFVSQDAGEPNQMKCRDLYRMLEITGYSLQRFKSIFRGEDEPEDTDHQSYAQIGDYRIRRQIGRGFHGVCCYLGEHLTDSTRVAVKWPAKQREVSAFEDIQQRVPSSCLGLPRLLASGAYDGQPYLVTELLGSSLMKLFQFLESEPLYRRWGFLRVVGRLVVRRLQALHSCGYVHCDVSPENILLGHTRQLGKGGVPQFTLYLIDLELAQRHPCAKKLDAHFGSAEWSSIQSAEGGQRLPEDDLEALGWVLLNGLCGALPWFEWLGVAYKDWDSKWSRDHVLRQVQRAKLHLLSEGWEAFAGKMAGKLPEEPATFIRACRHASTCGQPDYLSLISILGGDAGLSTQEADEEDLRQFAAILVQLDRSPREKAEDEQRKVEARRGLARATACRDVNLLRAALGEGERVGLLPKEMALARSMVDAEELKDDARESLREAVASGDIRHICQNIRECEMAGLDDVEVEEARRALTELEDKARIAVQNAIQSRDCKALGAAIESGELAGIPEEELQFARRTLADVQQPEE